MIDKLKLLICLNEFYMEIVKQKSLLKNYFVLKQSANQSMKGIYIFNTVCEKCLSLSDTITLENFFWHL